MDIFAFLTGLIISILIIFYFYKKRIEHAKSAYPFLLITFPVYYFVFAIYGQDYRALTLEVFAGVIFILLAVLSLRYKGQMRYYLLASGYLLHGIYDIVHHMLFINHGAPIWWPEFCGVIDIVLGLYLVKLGSQKELECAKQ